MSFRALLIAAAIVLTGSVNAQTRWDMPTPYGDDECQTINVRQFAGK